MTMAWWLKLYWKPIGDDLEKNSKDHCISKITTSQFFLFAEYWIRGREGSPKFLKDMLWLKSKKSCMCAFLYINSKSPKSQDYYSIFLWLTFLVSSSVFSFLFCSSSVFFSSLLSTSGKEQETTVFAAPGFAWNLSLGQRSWKSALPVTWQEEARHQASVVAVTR